MAGLPVLENITASKFKCHGFKFQWLGPQSQLFVCVDPGHRFHPWLLAMMTVNGRKQ
jgi:hypothetical protein